MSLTSFIVNFYDALGIEKNASADEGENNQINRKFTDPPTIFAVRKAYKKKILETHPDKLDPNACTRVKQAAGMQFHRVWFELLTPESSVVPPQIQTQIPFLQIREAFEILGDVEKRKVLSLPFNIIFLFNPVVNIRRPMIQPS